MKTSDKKKVFQIAIDGPVAAGKSTAAKKIAERLNFLYVDTGAMYRAVALCAKQSGVDWDDEEGVTELMNTLDLELDKPNGGEDDGRLVTVLLNGEDVSLKIRTSEIGEGASVVSTYAGVREVLVEMQRNIADGENVVMEGRDIGTRVLQRAKLKIYMDASVEVRVLRKWKFLKRKGEKLGIKQVRADLVRRDERERGREIDPLRPAVGAWRFDTTDLAEEEVVGEICNKVVEFGG